MKLENTVLDKKEIWTDYVHTPKGYEVNKNAIKSSALHYFFIEKKRFTDDETNHKYHDFKIDYTKEVDYFLTLIRERFHITANKGLVLNKSWANCFYPMESSIYRNNLNIDNLAESPDLSLVYGVDVVKDSCRLVIEYETNRKYTFNWNIPMDTNKFVLFPSGCNYYITKNKSDNLNVFFGGTYSTI